MRASLSKWVSDADAARHVEEFRVAHQFLELAYIQERADDYYIALTGELFDSIRNGDSEGPDWARLGNALAQFASRDRQRQLQTQGVSDIEARLFAAAAFYFGGFPASAYVTLRGRDFDLRSETWKACYELLARPTDIRSSIVQQLLTAIRTGNLQLIAELRNRLLEQERLALPFGPDQWVPAHLLTTLLARFSTTNVRAVLPAGDTDFWSPLVATFLDRRPPAWEFFPSQIQAIQAGLLERSGSCSLQMPTGAGKTALTETLLYYHLKRNTESVAILLVPYRSLASELRWTLVKRLNSMGISARAAYGGTVPTGDEVQELDRIQALVATPETLSGMLGVNQDFYERASLVICDEGHLLDGGSRGISLELLLARLRARATGPPRFVFVSAIVPNIEEINSWLGGDSEAGFVVRSDYSPALAEFAVLESEGSGNRTTVALKMHPQESQDLQFSIEEFLTRRDFQWLNPRTGRIKTLSFNSIKTQALAAARKALAMGAVAVFAANKRGTRGAVGLANSLLNQLQSPLSLPKPSDFVSNESLTHVADYLRREYGADWVGTRALAAGAVLHHGDIPQETREVLETLLRNGSLRFVICTSTLAEGVNFPIRTLVIYSVQRLQKAGHAQPMLARDIKNLVGRAGRAGATTKGLVITANPEEWSSVEPVARLEPGEPVRGALLLLVDRLRDFLAARKISLTNERLENSPVLHSLVDGIDATLVDLAAEEIGDEQLVQLAVRLARETFAARQADVSSRTLLESVFRLRAERVSELHRSGRLRWLRETGARLRMVDSVESGLLPQRLSWEDVADPLDSDFVTTMLTWTWSQRSLQASVREAYRIESNTIPESIRDSFFTCVRAWLAGSSFNEITLASGSSVDDFLGVYTRTIAFELQTLVEQSIALLRKLLEQQERSMAPAVEQFPEHLRHGVPTSAAKVLASNGVRHRRAAVTLGTSDSLRQDTSDNKGTVFISAERELLSDEERYKSLLGDLVFEHTLADLAAVTRNYR